MGIGSFVGVNRPGRGVDHPPPSSTEVKKKSRAVHLLPLWAFVACSRVVFSTAGPRPGTGPWHQLYRSARGLRKLQYATRFHLSSLLITNLHVILYLSTCHTVYISVLILFMIMV